MKTLKRNFRKEELLVIIILSFIPLFFHLYTNAFASYGYFRDELYYVACTNKLDFGYVDQPPLSIHILALSRFLFGDALFALRLIPAIVSALIVFFTSFMVIRLGGKIFAIIIASVAVIFAPIYLGMCTIYSMNCFDILLWTIATYVIILIVKENKLKYWIILGIVIGLGLLNKIGFLWMAFGFFAGLILTDKRKEFFTIKPWLCAFIALMIFSPYILWNIKHDFAHLEFIRNATSGKYSELTRVDFVLGQFLNMNPPSAIIWISGLYYFLFNKGGKKFRILAIIYLTSFLILVINGNSKAEYLAAAYPMLFAGGGVFIEKITEVKLKWLRYPVIVLIVSFGTIITPLALPILPVERYIKYAETLGFAPSTSENKELSELPQFYADMFGWEELAKNVSTVYQMIPEAERNKTIVFGQNYGEAGAIEFFKNKYPLPKAISSHNTYWLWGYSEIEDPIVIIIGGDSEDHFESFKKVKKIIVHTAKYSMPYENNISIYVARDIKRPLQEIWNQMKNYD